MAEPAQTILCFDFGTRRMGVAVGRRIQSTATELKPIPARDGIPDWQLIQQLVDEWLPDAFVVGLPLNMDGSDNEMTRRATKFAKRLQGRFNRPYYLMDERLSSHEAKGYVIRQGGDRDFGKNSVDGIAACLILESWFAQTAADQKNME